MAISDLCLSFADKDKKKDKDEGKKRVARPFGVSMLVAGIDSKGPQLLCTDPSGNYIRYKACAIGPASESAMSLIMENFKQKPNLQEGIKLAAKVIKENMEDRINRDNIELSYIKTSEKKIVHLTPNELEELIKTV